jgi:hypothetical protein
MKKRKILLSVLVPLLLLFTYRLGYWTGLSHAQKGPRVIVAMDTADSQQSYGKAEHDPYFTKQNPIPDKVK